MPETLEDLDGIGERRTERLRAAGYETIEDLRAASPRELAVVEGIGESLSSRIKSQVGTRRPGTAAASTGEPLVAPEDWRITRREAVHLEEMAGIDAEELVGETAAGVQDRLELRVDWESLFFRRVCGRVVKPDPETGDLQPVPNATVHVEDTDCSFLGYFPEPWPWGWFFPLRCRREEIATVRTDECGRFCVLVPRWEIDRILRSGANGSACRRSSNPTSGTSSTTWRSSRSRSRGRRAPDPTPCRTTPARPTSRRYRSPDRGRRGPVPTSRRWTSTTRGR